MEIKSGTDGRERGERSGAIKGIDGRREVRRVGAVQSGGEGISRLFLTSMKYFDSCFNLWPSA